MHWVKRENVVGQDAESVLFLSGYSLPCAAGFICLAGSNVAKPTDGVKGYICPAGHYCLQGAVIERPCAKGTYAPSRGLGACLKCAAGECCPYEGMNATLVCPTGHYCPNSTANFGTPCPVGKSEFKIAQ
jgi:hypothetical protein